MRASESETPAPSPLIALAGLLVSLGLGYLALSQSLPPPAAAARLGAPPELVPCVMDRDGYWQGRLFGVAPMDVNWRGAELKCAGNARPNGRGLRLFFAGRPGAGADRLLLVLGIATDIMTLAGREHPVSITVIDEASSQFFHSPGDRCFTRVLELSPLAAEAASYRVNGELYCVGAIAAVSGDAALTIGDTTYSGRLTLGDE